MVIRPEGVHGIRAAVLGCLRLLAVALVGLGVYLVGARVAFGVLGRGDVTEAWRVWQGVGEGHGVFRGLPMIGVGIALGLASRRIVWWAVRPAETGCPACGFDTDAGERLERCPECGLRGLGDQPG